MSNYSMRSALLEQALRKLVDKLDKINSDPSYQSIWTLAAAHGIIYDGPNYEKELRRAKQALKKDRC